MSSEEAELRSGASPGTGDPRKSQSSRKSVPDFADYDPSKDPKGRGAWITWGVLGVILLCVLVAAYRLHGFWWQA